MIISILIFLSALIFGVISILRGVSMRSNATYNDTSAKNAGSKKIRVGIITIISGLILSFIQPFSLERIDVYNGYIEGNVCLVCLEFNTTDNTIKYKNIDENLENSGWTKEKFNLFLKNIKCI
jgi:heme/copper-type cytochrome/quinol oxidase subunit 2